MLNIVFSFCGCYLLWYLSKHLYDRAKFLNCIGFVGANSILLFAYHRPVLNFLIAPLLKKVLPMASPLIYSLVAFVSLIGIYILALPVVRRVPWVLGDARRSV